jgi:CubicO group peptidase (beta-lactamase class C family)
MVMALRMARFPFLLLLILAIGVACDFFTGPDDEYPVPPQTNDGWETASLEDVGMEPDSLLALLDLISNTEDHLIHSILIVKDEKLVFEQYWDGIDLFFDESTPMGEVTRNFDRDALHYMASVSKSFTSALVGIAVDRGLIGGVEDPVFSYFPEHEDLKNDGNAQIALADLLAMRSGFDWNEFEYGFDDPRDSHHQMFAAADPMRFLLGRPLVSTPGTEFLYNSGDTNILGEVVRRSSSSSYLADFAESYLFEPLGIDTYRWTRMTLADEVTFASGGMYLRPRDMAKFGLLYLSGGSWNGRQIVSSAWVDASKEMSIPLVGYRTLYGYGYQFWLGRLPYGDDGVEYYLAAGWGGQYIYVISEFDMVVVFTAGGYYDTRPISFQGVIENYIFESIVD